MMVEASVEVSKVYPLARGTRQAIVNGALENTRYHQAVEERKPGDKAGWEIYDSYLGNNWDDSSFQVTFACLLPEGECSLRSYIERLLTRKRGAAVGIEFGGPGSNLFGDFSQGFFRQTAGVTLADIRTDSSKERDDERHHTVIAGNMFSSQTQQEIAKWLSGRKVDVIFERMDGGLHLVPREPRFLADIANNWYQMLAEGGVMFIQIPRVLVPVMEAWKNFVKQKYPDQIQVQEKFCTVNSQFLGVQYSEGLMILNKLTGAPANLPLLPPRTVRDLYKEASLYWDGSGWVGG